MGSEVINEFSGKYRWLSNFFSCFITFENQTYMSVENAYQAAKMKNLGDRERFLHIKSSEAKKLGRLLPMRDDWDLLKKQIMFELVKQKFSSSSELKSRLLNTGSAILEEGNWWGDVYWGTVNGFGENHLGKILMEVREELREATV